MDGITTGTGVAALGFWLFVAAIIAVGVWDSIRKRDAQHETLRRIVESGQTVDDEMVNKLLSITDGNPNVERDLRISGMIMAAIGPGMALFGWVGSAIADEFAYIMYGVACLMIFISLGLFGAASIVRRSTTQRD